jgi:hypothetical protein
MPVEIKVTMPAQKLDPFLESFPAKLAQYLFKVISEIYIHKAMSGGRPPAGFNDEAWPPLSRLTIYRKLLAEHRRRRARLWRKAHTSYINLLERKRTRRPKSDPHLVERLWHWTRAGHIAGAKEDIQAQWRQEVYGAPPSNPMPRYTHQWGDAPAGDLQEFLRSLHASFMARRRVARLTGVPIKRVRRASLPPTLRRFWKKVYARAYPGFLQAERAKEGATFASARRSAAARAARKAWRSVIRRAERLAYVDYDAIEAMEGKTRDEKDAILRSAIMRALIGESFLTRHRLREHGALESSMVLMMIDSGAIYNSLLPGAVGRNEAGQTQYIIDRRSGRGPAEDKQHRRPGHICDVTVYPSTEESPIRAEVTVGVRVVDRVEVGKGDTSTIIEVPYAVYHHLGPSVEQEPGRRGPRPKRRLWPADLQRLLSTAVTRLLQASRVNITGVVGLEDAPEGSPT